MSSATELYDRTPLAEGLRVAFGEVRAEYETDDALFDRFSEPIYFAELLGMAPKFLVGGRGTGKTTTLRSMSFRGQSRISQSRDPETWRVVGSYWKAEPNVVSAFRGKGLTDEVWASIFSHYLNLRLAASVLEYVGWADLKGWDPNALSTNRKWALFCQSLYLTNSSSDSEAAEGIDTQLVEIERRLNGSIRSLTELPMSVLGRPLEYLFAALGEVGAATKQPFVFCIDEYENFEPYQQRLVNTLIKAVGSVGYTFNVGIRAAPGILRETLVEGQPLQDPADFHTVDIVRHLKDASFEQFASTVINQRLGRLGSGFLPLQQLLPSISTADEVHLLGGEHLSDDIIEQVRNAEGVQPEDVEFAENESIVSQALLRYWAASHGENIREVVRFARSHPKQWSTRVGNHSYEMLFTLRQRAVGPRKYYSGWRTYWQLADGNIRYLLRLTYEALRLHVSDGGDLSLPVGFAIQTEAAKRAGETTLQELQGWSHSGGALARMALSLGAIFGGLARQLNSTTPETNQFRVRYSQKELSALDVEILLTEAVGQGVVIAFAGDKNGKFSGATLEKDFQLHPIFAPYFTYSPRSKRRITISADDVLSMSSRHSAPTIRRLLDERGLRDQPVPNQLQIFESGPDFGS